MLKLLKQFLRKTLKEIRNPGYLETTIRDLYSQFPKQAQDFLEQILRLQFGTNTQITIKSNVSSNEAVLPIYMSYTIILQLLHRTFFVTKLQ